jgi:hypothetical protein
MKRFALVIITLLMSISLFSQERTISKSLGNNETYIKYSGRAADTLIATNQDTIDFVLEYRGEDWVKKIAVKSKFDSIAGADTTVSVSVFGKEFGDDATYVQIIGATVSDAVTTNDVVQVLTSDYTETIAAATDQFNSDSTTTVAARTVTPLDKSYRYYRVRYIVSGDDSVGAGIKIDEIEFKLYTN